MYMSAILPGRRSIPDFGAGSKFFNDFSRACMRVRTRECQFGASLRLIKTSDPALEECASNLTIGGSPMEKSMYPKMSRLTPQVFVYVCKFIDTFELWAGIVRKLPGSYDGRG